MRYLILSTLLFACTQVDAPDASISIEEKPEASVEIVEEESIEKPCIPPEHQKILMVGDSQTGYTSWFVNKVKRPGESVVADYKGGTSLLYWNYGHFLKVMRNNVKPDVLIIFLGTTVFNFPYLQPIQNILDEIERRHLTCIWVGPTQVNHQNHQINQLLKKAVEPTCTYVDTEKLDIPLEDGVHPTKNGAIKWLKDIWEVKDFITCGENPTQGD